MRTKERPEGQRYARKVLHLAAAALFSITLLVGACQGQDRTRPDLDQMAAEILPRLQVLSGLEAREPIRLAWQSRDEMNRFIERQLDEELPAEYIDGVRAAYVAFGLLPDTIDLRRLLLDLYSEQVVGYYDPPTKTLYLIEGAPTSDIRTVLAHELVHALQDQHVDLDSLVSRELGNDRQTAAQAAFEGHATLVMFALMIEEQLGRPITPGMIPPLGGQLQSLLEAQNSQFPVFRDAPRLIRETLLFPYIGGASYVQTLWDRAEQRAGAGAETTFPAPIDSFFPESTEQVLHPVDHLLAERDHPTDLELEPGPAAARVIHEGTLGELEIGILLREHLGNGADAAARGWDGDTYRLIGLQGGNAIIWYSVWDDAASAGRFADAYRRVLNTRPERRGRVERIEVDGRPLVLVVDAESGVDPAAIDLPGVSRLTER